MRSNQEDTLFHLPSVSSHIDMARSQRADFEVKKRPFFVQLGTAMDTDDNYAPLSDHSLPTRPPNRQLPTLSLNPPFEIIFKTPQGYKCGIEVCSRGKNNLEVTQSFQQNTANTLTISSLYVDTNISHLPLTITIKYAFKKDFDDKGIPKQKIEFDLFIITSIKDFKDAFMRCTYRIKDAIEMKQALQELLPFLPAVTKTFDSQDAAELLEVYQKMIKDTNDPTTFWSWLKKSFSFC